MDTKELITALGGRKKVIEMTGLTRGRISQWVQENQIPRPWIKFFQAKYPRIDWKAYEPQERRTGERRKAERRISH